MLYKLISVFRFGRKLVLTAGTCGCVASLVASYFSPNYLLFLFARFVIGVCSNAQFTAAYILGNYVSAVQSQTAVSAHQ